MGFIAIVEMRYPGLAEGLLRARRFTAIRKVTANGRAETHSPSGLADKRNPVQ